VDDLFDNMTTVRVEKEGNLCTSHHMNKGIFTLFPDFKHLISTITPGVKWFFFKVKNVASR